MIHFILGTKAQLIKTAPVMHQLTKEGISYNYIFTGQHKETMTEIEDNFKIKKPDYTIYEGDDIVSKKEMLFWLIKSIYKVIRNRKEVFKNDKKGIVLVHGDTVSTVLGSLLGKICGFKVGHIESGLRSFNIWQPFPEEICRIITFNLSDYYYCPGEWPLNNLKPYRGHKINTNNNTLYDALRLSRQENFSTAKVEIPEYKFGVVTLHRFENLKNKVSLEKIVDLLLKIAKTEKLIFILHKPTELKLKEYDLLNKLKDEQNIELRNRYAYFSFMKLLNEAEFVISDGGSNQEECYYLGKPVLLFRNVSERKEGLGRNAIISKFDEKLIFEFLASKDKYQFDFLELAENPTKIITDSIKKFQ